MAFQHTCICTIKRSSGGQEETVGSLSEKELGTYETANDSCERMREANTYSFNDASGTIIQTASCELD
jgi:hypothetical protein